MADSCSKQDYITVATVDSFSQNLTKRLSVTEDKCEDDEVSQKCETCDLLLCEKCEAPHTASESDGGCHTTKSVSSSAEEIQKKLQGLYA